MELVKAQSEPLLTFVLPAYNVEKYITQSVESVVSVCRKCKDIEIIIVNDGSTDSTGVILENLVGKYPFINVVHQMNGGLSAARNTGIRHASGKYIWFVDSDDYLNEDSAIKLIGKLSEGADAYFFGRILFSDGHESLQPDLCAMNYESGLDFLNDTIRRGSFRTNAWDKIFKLNLIDKLNLTFKEGLLYEDMFFCLQYFSFAGKVSVVKEYPYVYRLNNDSSITHIARKKDLDVLEFLSLADIFITQNAQRMRIVRGAVYSMLFNWTSSCLLNKYIPLMHENELAKKIVYQVFSDSILKKCARICLVDGSNRRYKLFAGIYILSKRLYICLINIALKKLKNEYKKRL